MKVITRKQMMNKEVSHDEYMRQFVTDSTLAYVDRHIGKDKILASTDPHFNDIPLQLWDRISFTSFGINDSGSFSYLIPVASAAIFAEAGESRTRSVAVSIAKTAARIIKEILEERG